MLSDKVAIITGSGQGIGKAIALNLARNGADIVVSDIVEQSVGETVEEIKQLGRKAEGIICNVSDFDSCRNLIGETISRLGHMDILVNNAGITKDNLLLKMTPEDFDRVIEVNLKGTFNCCKAALPKFPRKTGGRVINISSVVGVMGNAGQANYAASKAGVIGLTRSLAREYARRNITVNAIAPGYIQTAMTEVLSEDAKDAIKQMIPMQNLGTPEDVANGALFLASDLASYITGHVLHINGGMIMA